MSWSVSPLSPNCSMYVRQSSDSMPPMMAAMARDLLASAAPALAGEVKGGEAYSSLDPKDDVAKIPGFLDGLGFSAPDVRTFTVQLAHPSPYFKWVATMPERRP